MGAILIMLISAALPAYAETVQCVNSYNGYQVKTYVLPANTLDPGQDQHNTLQTNAAAARQDMGKTYFTTELTSFNDSQCVDGPCRNNIPGIAHRTWPLNSCVAVCNVATRVCALALVMDKGPNTQLRCRTIDANPALQAKLNMKGGTIHAAYTLVAMPGEPCTLGNLASPAVDPSLLNIQSVSSPISGAYGGYSGGSSANLMQYLQSPQQGMAVSTGQPASPSQPAQPSTSVGTSDQISGSVGGSASVTSGPAPAVATLVTQSSEAIRGRQIIVSWSSLGMRTDQECSLAVVLPDAPEQLVKAANNGSETVHIPLTANQGTATFRLRCNSVSAQTIEKTVSVTVQ